MPNEINLFGVIGNVGGERGITSQQVKTLLAKMDQTQPLVVRIDSGGGSVFDGLSIYEAFANYPGPKKAVIESTAFSIASYIAMAFDDVEIAENGYVMIHEPAESVDGTASDLTKSAETLAKLDQSMVEAYARKTGQAEDAIRSMMQAESFLNATEALEHGFVNSIAQSRVTTRIAPTANHSRKLPQRVYAALFGAGPNGDPNEPTKEKPVADSTPTAATIKEIKAAHPKMKAEFFVRCLEKEMPLASVASAAADELLTENETLTARIAEMEEELTALRGKAKAESEAEEEPAAEGEEEEQTAEGEQEELTAKAKATAKTGAKPVARSRTAPNLRPASEQWEEAIQAELPRAKSRKAAVAIVNRKNPSLRERLVAEANAAR